MSLSVELRQQKFGEINDLTKWVSEKLDYLVTARPTAVNMLDCSIKLKKFMKTQQNSGATLKCLQEALYDEIERMQVKDVEDNKAIGRYGAEHMLENVAGDRLVMLTHCNTGSLATAGYGTALGVVRALQEKQRLVMILLLLINYHHLYCCHH